MKTGLAFVCALGVSLLAGRAGAETPSGSYTIAVNGDSGLIVPTGEGEVCESGVCVSTDVATNPDGIVSGTGHVLVDGGTTADVALELAGRVSGTTAKPKLVLAFIGSGQASGFNVEGKGKLKCALGASPSALDCDGKVKLCAFELGRKLGCEKAPFATQVAFQRQPFTLELDLQTVLSSTVTGSADALIGAITIASYDVKGKYDSGADASNLVLKGVDPVLKTKVALKKVVLAAGAPTAGTAVFRLMGQKGVVELPSIAPMARTRSCSPSIAGGFCDVNQDTAALFRSGASSDPVVIDGTVFFGILGASSRSR